MKRILTALVLGISLLFASGENSYAQDFQKGLEAYDKGDYATALREWSMLAEQGNALAQFALGLEYSIGQGFLQDDVYAHMWLNIAASNGNADAVKGRDIVAEQMTSSQMAEAQKLARACVAKKFKDC